MTPLLAGFLATLSLAIGLLAIPMLRDHKDAALVDSARASFRAAAFRRLA